MKDKKILAIASVAILLVCAVGGVMVTTDDAMTEESDAIILNGLIIMGLACLASFSLGWILNDLQDKTEGNTDSYTRDTESAVVAQSILDTRQNMTNALANYTQTWNFTDEHWIRMAELAASFTWKADSPFSQYDILTASGVYHNSCNMLENGANQINEYMGAITERLALWNTTDVYKDKMTLKFSYGSGSISSKTAFEGHLASTVSVKSDSNSKVYLNGGDLWVFGGPATIRSEDGTEFTLRQGYNDLSGISGFKSDAYALESGKQYAGRILPVIGAGAATVNAGFVMKAGDVLKLATYDSKNSCVIIDNVSRSDLKISITPDGGQTRSTDIIAILKEYSSLISAVRQTMINASSAAVTVWDIYDQIGSASSYLTTLMIPNEYNNVSLSQSQKTIMTVMAMKQLAEDYDSASGKFATKEYKITPDSMTLFCRGNIYNAHGDLLHENVIFTPFYYGSDLTLHTGANPQTQTSIIAIWGSGTTLSAWSQTATLDKTALSTVSSGSKIEISEIKYGEDYVSSVDLDVRQLDIIDTNKITPDPVKPKEKTGTDWIQIILIVFGIIAAIAGLFSGRPGVIVIGAVCIVMGIAWGLIA